MEQQSRRSELDLSARIPGWGSDLEPRFRPGVPMDKAPDIGSESLYPDISPQTSRVKIHKSTEHGQMPPVFGTTCPPKGLSGFLRDYAYRLSEGRLMHWMLLILADRVDVVEGIVADLFRFRVPNIPKEMGLKSEFKYNRPRAIRKAAIVGALVGGAIYLLRRRQARVS